MLSKQKQLEQWLLAGHGITGWLAWRKFGMYRLAAAIFRIREKREVKMEMVGSGKDQFARYYIPKAKKK
jgi:hypothetical protein